MIQSTARIASRRLLSSKLPFNPSSAGRRFLSTAPPAQKSRGWKSSAARWAIAGGAVYYYNTSSVFAEQPEAAIQQLDESLHHIQESKLPTVDAIVAEKQQRQAQRQSEEAQRKEAYLQSRPKSAPQENGEEVESAQDGSMEDLEEDASQQGAFNEETGEINWDCPCLGGMAHGPCGEEFREAFSCFVYSKEEPKGMECIEKFKGMQDCFRLHPEMYGSELEDDEDEVEEELRADEAAKVSSSQSSLATDASTPQSHSSAVSSESDSTPVKPTAEKGNATESKSNSDEGGELVPRAMHDATPK